MFGLSLLIITRQAVEILNMYSYLKTKTWKLRHDTLFTDFVFFFLNSLPWIKLLNDNELLHLVVK